MQTSFSGNVRFVSAALAAACLWLQPVVSLGAEAPLLKGRVTSTKGQAVAGIPVRAKRDNSTITVSVYTDAHGDYSFPVWTVLSPGSYTVAVEVREFAAVNRPGVILTAGKSNQLNLSLEPREPTIDDATAGEIAMAMAGSEDQKFMLTQCSQCHSLQFALRKARTKEDWLKVVTLMAGPQRSGEDRPGTRAFDQKPLLEPMAEYLATIRGPGSSDKLPFKLRSRPTSAAATNLVYTEYDVPRGGTYDLMTTRGDHRYAWPHDILLDPNGKYAWYTDHFANILGRLEIQTGEVKEFPFTPSPRRTKKDPGSGEGVTPEDARAGAPGRGAHKITLLPNGTFAIGSLAGTILFDPKTEQFKAWPAGSVMFGIDPAGKIWYFDSLTVVDHERALHELNPETGEVKTFKAPFNAGGYDVDTDTKGKFVYNGWRSGVMGVFDPATEKYSEYPTPTLGSGPRRGAFDASNRYWASEYWSGRILMFEPSKGLVKEFSLLPDTAPYREPFLAAYTTAVDDKNQWVWTTDFNSSRLYRFDMKTEKSIEYYTPLPYELRDLKVDRAASRPTVWLPAYRPPSKLVKVEVR